MTGIVTPPRLGLWVNGLDLLPPAAGTELVTELEGLGLGALWLSEGVRHDPFVTIARLAAATGSLVFGTGIAVVHGRHPQWLRASARALHESHPGRFTLGLGTSHARVVRDILGLPVDRPLTALREHLDELDRPDRLLGMLGLPDPAPVPRVLAALGPRALKLAGDRADGAITYLVTPEHTAQARELLGPGPTLVVEQAVTLDPAATDRARAHVLGYAGGAAYRANWRRAGFSDAEIDRADPRLLRDLVAMGEDAMAERVTAHLAAGADQVCLQVLAEGPGTVPADELRAVTGLLGGMR